MDLLVLDTDVCSFLFKRDSRAQVYRVHLEGHNLSISFQTMAEIYQWAYLHGWGDQRIAQMEQWLRRFIVLPFDYEICRNWARIRMERQRNGKPMSAQDAWIAACALRHDCPLVTHNPRDYAGISGLSVISEAEGIE